MNEYALATSELSVNYLDGPHQVHALRSVSIRVRPGEIVGVVGESGCGKSTLAAAVLRLLPSNGWVAGGRIEVDGVDLLELDDAGLRSLRGRRIARIAQDPSRSLNPTLTVGRQLRDVLRAHLGRLSSFEVKERCEQALTDVGLGNAAHVLKRYPHELSGGMRQRAAIAMALLLRPALLVADEPTSALDVTLEAQIVDLLRSLRDEHGTSILFVSHNLGVVSLFCDRAVVMYAGEVVETGLIADVYGEPGHPYTAALLAAIPDPRRLREPLVTIPGRPPTLYDAPDGCAFADRCPLVHEVCRMEHPVLYSTGTGQARCLRHAVNSDYATSPAMERA